MKELTIEQKAKAYDEAIKRLEYIKTGECQKTFVFTEGLFDYIFPELREESEDERIRKALIKYYSFDKDGGSHALDNITPKQIVTWLEKQGEQKPAIKMKTPEESLGIDSETYNKIVDKCVYGEQKSAWSEEDEKAINDIMWIIKAYRENGFNETHIQMADSSENWLKSLKDRVQPKQEWSEDTQQWIDAIIFDYESWYDADKDHRTTIQAKINILKSLKERYSWKPSDEQMGVLLSEVTAWTKGCPKQIVLESLYNDLLKLKE